MPGAFAIAETADTTVAYIDHQADAASAMTYNELAQVLESKNPKTGKLFTLNDLTVIPMQSVGTAMLEDGIFSTESWLNDAHHKGGEAEKS